jgi:hypothetical protein
LEIHNNVLDADVGPGGESHEPYQEQADVLQNSRTENKKQRYNTPEKVQNIS